MKIRDILVPLSLALITTWAVNYFFFKRYGQPQKEQAAQTFIAPKEQKPFRPLNREIDFIDTKRSSRAVISEMETDWGNVVFSSDGASLESIEFKRTVNGKDQTIRTIFPPSQTEREDRCFLVGLQEKTPYFYRLVNRKDGDDAVELQYQADFDEGVIRKTFIIDNHTYKIDLKLEISPKRGLKKGIEARIFYSSPIMPEIVESDVISSIVIDQRDVFEKTDSKRLDEQRGWYIP